MGAATFLPPPCSTSFLLLNSNSKPFHFKTPKPLSCRRPGICKAMNSEGDSSPPPAPEAADAPEQKVQIRFRRVSRRQARKQAPEGLDPPRPRPPPAPKDWESMTLGEKAVELYMGEKGLLFWLNKFAYASIFIVIGAWILFRFVGPSIGLYQLDAPPLSPTSMFKGS